MKRLICVVLALTLMLSMAACGGSKPAETTGSADTNLEGTVEELLNRIIEKQPVEFDGEVTAIDLTDTSEEGKWLFESTTGLTDPVQLTEAAVFEPLMGSLAFSMVMVRTADGIVPENIAQAMKSGINPRKWVCVEADDLLVAGCGNVVMLIMLSADTELTAQKFLDAFRSVAGRELDFVI